MYSFRYRTTLPKSIQATAPEGMHWIIRSTGRSRYSFVLAHEHRIVPSRMLAETKVPDATPGVVAMYSMDDEQALLAKVRYNRLIDIFTGVTAYSLQNHLRTTVPGMGQVETDEIYIGVDARGAHYVFPVQAKGGTDQLSVVQIEQDFAMCATKFPGLIRRPIGAQFIQRNLIALFGFELMEGEVRLLDERHYRLVPPDQLTPEELLAYQARPLPR